MYLFLDKFTNYFAYRINYQQLPHPFFPPIDQKAEHFQSSTAVKQLSNSCPTAAQKLLNSCTDIDQHQLTS